MFRARIMILTGNAGRRVRMAWLLLLASGCIRSAGSAHSILRQAASVAAPSPDELLQHIATLVEQGKFAEAETPARKAAKLAPGSVVAHNLLRKRKENTERHCASIPSLSVRETTWEICSFV